MNEQTFPQRIADICSYLSVRDYLILLGIILVIAALILWLSERKRMNASAAAVRTEQLKNSENAKLSDTYDITSSKHVGHAEYEAAAKQAKGRIPAMLLSICMMTIIMLSAMGIYGLLDTIRVAKQHGFADSLGAIRADNMWEIIDRTPVNDSIPEDRNGCIFLFYRFGCADCDATYQDIIDATSGLDNVYWIATRTKEGKAFAEELDVDVVPKGVYVQKDGTVLLFTLYKRLGNGDTVINEDSLANLLLSVQYDREN